MRTCIKCKMMVNRAIAAMAVITVVLALPQANAADIGAFDSGWYDDFNGQHIPTSQNYVASKSLAQELRNFFVFDLSAVSGTVTGATLNLRRYNSTTSNDTYSSWDVTTPLATLLAGGTGLFSIFNDLGSGTFYGSSPVPNTGSSGDILSFPLNTTAVTAINSALGGTFVIGGSTTGNLPLTQLFGGSNFPGPNERFLTLTGSVVVIPVPLSLVLLGSGFGGLLLVGRGRRNN